MPETFFRPTTRPASRTAQYELYGTAETMALPETPSPIINAPPQRIMHGTPPGAGGSPSSPESIPYFRNECPIAAGAKIVSSQRRRFTARRPPAKPSCSPVVRHVQGPSRVSTLWGMAAFRLIVGAHNNPSAGDAATAATVGVVSSTTMVAATDNNRLAGVDNQRPLLVAGVLASRSPASAQRLGAAPSAGGRQSVR